MLNLNMCTPRDLAPLLLSMPRLAVLQLSRNFGDINALVDIIACAEPALPFEEVNFSKCTNLSCGSLRGLVLARMPREVDSTSSGIRSLVIDESIVLDADILPWLQSHVARVSARSITAVVSHGK